MDGELRVVVVGCSGAGALAALMLKKLDPGVDVTVIREQDEQGLLTRCATPYVCCGDVLLNPSYKSDDIFTSQGIQLVNMRARSIDRKTKTVWTADSTGYSYDKLVVATGAEPLMPPIVGIGLQGVFTLRKGGDAFGILQWMNTHRVRSAVIVGGGAIGVEVAYLVGKKGVNVHLVEMFPHVLSGAIDTDMIAGVEDYIQRKGVDLKLGEKVAEVLGSTVVEGVLLQSGERIDAEIVIVSAGTVPRSKLAAEAGLEMGDRGLRVNKYLQTSDPDIYAAGDLIEYPHFVTGKPCLGQLRPNAVIGGRMAARNILGRSVEYPGYLNSFATKFFDKSIAGTGITESEAARHGIETVCTRQESATMHSMMRDKKPYALKLIFDRKSAKVIGGQIVSDSESPIRHIDALAVAIRSGWTASQLATLRCAGQPELSPDPGREPIALAAEAAVEVLEQSGVS